MRPARRAQQLPRASRGSDRSRARGRGSPFQTPSPPTPSQTNGSSPRRASSSPFRGSRGRPPTRGRGSLTKRFDTSPAALEGPKLPILPINPPPDQIKAYDHDQLEARRAKLSEQYEKYRQDAIARGLMSDDKQSTLDDAIKTVGSCTQMCDEKERVNRIYESQTDAAERLPCPETGRSVPIEGRMVKKFRRSAAGVDKQIPEELRTPRTLQKTLDYLFNEIIGKNRLGKHHKFVWDRTRAIRNDFSIQSSTKPEHVKYEVDCYERIVRFHILSAHQLSNPENLEEDEHFEHQQELEQLQKTFQSLMDKYDAFRATINFSNEPEFRAYYILFSPILFSFDTEVQIQKWPKAVLNDGRVQTALALYAAMGNTHRSVGSKNLEPIPVAVAQANSGRFWALLDSRRVGYLMACVAEMSFQSVRFTALNALWRSAKNASEKAQGNMKNWTRPALTEYLYFDHEGETEEFCDKLGIAFGAGPNGEEYLDFRSKHESSLDNPFSKPVQVFSESVVEQKRLGRTLVAVMDGMSIAQARRAGMIEEDFDSSPVPERPAKSSMMFVGDGEEDEQTQVALGAENGIPTPPAFSFNPQAGVFTPGSRGLDTSTDLPPKWMTAFGQPKSPTSTSSGLPPKGLFGQRELQAEPSEKPPPTNTTGSDPPVTFKIQGPASALLSGQLGLPSTGDRPSASSAFNGFHFTTASPQAPPFPATSNEDKSPKAVESETETFNLTTPTPSVASEVTKSPFNWPTTPSGKDGDSLPSATNLDNSTPASETKPGLSFNFGHSASTSQPLQSATTTLAPPFASSSVNTSSGSTTFSPQTHSTPAIAKASFSQVGILSSGPTTASGQSPRELSQPPPKQPSIVEVQCPAILTSAAEPESTTPPDSPTRPLSPKEQAAEPLIQESTPAKPLQSALRKSSLPARFPPQPEPVDNEQLLTQLCRIGLLQQDGIVDMFVSYKVSQLVKDVYNSFQRQIFTQRLTTLKQAYLKRKFSAKWRLIVSQRRLQKRAQRRRQKLSASVLAANEKRRKEERDMAEILEAQEFRRQMQEELKKTQEETVRKEKEQQDRRKTHKAKAVKARASPSTEPALKAGQKRKMLANSASPNHTQGITMSPMHKRSKTLGSSSDSGILKTSLVHLPSSRVSLSRSNNLRRSISQNNLRKSMTQQRLDQTQTDYFRLKAHGLDPDTPLVAESAADIAARKQKEAEQRQAANHRILRRPQSGLDTASTTSSLRSSPASGVAPTSPQPSPPRSSAALATFTSPAGEDPLLRDLREARLALGADQDWFKEKCAELEKEVEQQEALRRSQDSVSSREYSFAASAGGFARSVSGLEYVPPSVKPGQSLSRTERRIQQTGARGFATKPIGGTPAGSPAPEHPAIAVSRRPVSQHGTNHLTNMGQNPVPATSPGAKRPIDEVHWNGHSSSEEFHGEASSQLDQQVHKKRRNGTSQLDSRVQDTRPTKTDFYADNAHLADDGRDDDADEEEEEDCEEEAILQEHLQPQYAAADDEEEEAEYEDEELDEEDEESEVEEEDEFHAQYAEPYLGDGEQCVDENGDYLPVLSHHWHGRDSRARRAATPDTGAGSTAEAAIELSD